MLSMIMHHACIVSMRFDILLFIGMEVVLFFLFYWFNFNCLYFACYAICGLARNDLKLIW